jgi:membrane protease YdiL (CAAX protease family)
LSTIATPPQRARRWGPWATLAFGVVAMALMGITQTGGVLLYLLWQHAAHPEAPLRIQDLPSNGPALSVAFLLSAPVLTGLYWPTARDVLVGTASILGVLALAGIAASLLGMETPAFAGDTFGSAAETGFLPAYVLAFAVLAPVQEELLFRGFFYRGFAPAVGPIPAIVLLSAVWAVFHVQYNWFFVGEIFVMGLAFGVLRWRSGSLPLTIGLHMAVNGLAMAAAALMD